VDLTPRSATTNLHCRSDGSRDDACGRAAQANRNSLILLHGRLKRIFFDLYQCADNIGRIEIARENELSHMQQKRRTSHVLAAALASLWLSSMFSNSAQAEDADYAQIGWWQIIYRDTGTQTGCQAEARFNDQTNIAMALVQQDGSKSWFVFISNPRWNSWVSKKQQHIVILATINPNKIWRGPWGGVVNDTELALNASIDFVNSIADAKELVVLDDNKRLLTAPLNMKVSEAAIKAVVNCVRAHPITGPSGPEAEASPDQAAIAISGTAFFISSNLLLTNNHVVKECRNSI
jgi:hypothetical protein